MDQQNCINQIAELARTAWALRDVLLMREAAISPELVRLEESIHQLEAYLARLAPALNTTIPPTRTS